jgi:hypothetical protein
VSQRTRFPLDTGDIAWQDYGVTVRFRPVRGVQHGINVRVQGARQSRLLGFVGEGRVALHRKEAGHYGKLLSAPYDWQQGATYHFHVDAWGDRLQLAIDNERVLDHVDAEAPYLWGQIGLANGPGCRTGFERLEVRPASGPGRAARSLCCSTCGGHPPRWNRPRA